MNNGKPRECLLVSCASESPNSTLLLNPLTGTSCWSFRGNELQGGVSGVVEPLGRNPSHLCVAMEHKGVVYIVSLNSKSGHFASRSILPGVVRSLISHPSGQFIFGTIENRIFTWAIPSGQLLSIADDALQEITALKLSACGSYVVAGLADGNIKIYTLHSLIEERQHQVEPVRAVYSIAAHSLAVSDLHVTGCNMPRILSASLDHTVVLSSPTVKQPLLKICVDQPITSCCMDPAESRIIIGSKSGRICVISLYSYATNNTNEINILKIDDQPNIPGLQVFEHHADEVCKLCVNMDAQLLASADIAGHYCIWDLHNGQCLKSSSMKGRITRLRFTEYWSQLDADVKKPLGNMAKRNRQTLSTTTIGQLKGTVSGSTPNEELTRLMKGGRRPKIDEFLYKQLEDLTYALTEIQSTESDAKVASGMSDSLFDSTLSTSGTNNNAVVDDDIEILEVSTDIAKTQNDGKFSDKKDTFSENNNAPSTKQAERIRALEREIKHLHKVNQELYENAARLLTSSDL